MFNFIPDFAYLYLFLLKKFFTATDCAGGSKMETFVQGGKGTRGGRKIESGPGRRSG